MRLLMTTTSKEDAAKVAARMRHESGANVTLSRLGNTWRLYYGNEVPTITREIAAERVTRWATEPETLTDAQRIVAARYTRLFLSGRGNV